MIYEEIIKWETLSKYIREMLEQIFMNYNINELSNAEKRELIFDYLTKNIEYDYDLLNNIKQKKETIINGGHNSIERDSFSELPNVIINKKGICNAISQTYKLLLEEVGIYSICCVCNDGTIVRHELVLVQDNNSYSFDDPTSVIVNRGTKEQFFNYDLEDAKNNNQTKFIGLPSKYLNWLISREDKTYNEQLDQRGFLKLPSNIVKQKYSQKSK